MARATLRIQLLLLTTGMALSCAATPETARSTKTPTREAVVARGGGSGGQGGGLFLVFRCLLI